MKYFTHLRLPPRHLAASAALVAFAPGPAFASPTPPHLDVVGAVMSFAHLGAAWVMWVMIALALVLFSLIIERALLFTRTRINAPQLGRALLDWLAAGDMAQLKRLVARGSAMEERVVADALGAWEGGPHAVEQIIKGSLERERQRFERFLGYMGTVGSNAPFIGLFGTVIGIVLSFQELGANPKGGMAVVGPGIAEALASTAVGLVVAIPAVVAFNAFKGALTKRMGNVEFLGGLLLSHLKHTDQKEAR